MSATDQVSAAEALERRERAGYALRVMRGEATDVHQRATSQQEMTHRLGVHLPLLVLADMEVLLGARRHTALDISEGPDNLRKGLQQWQHWCNHLAASPVAATLARLRPSPGVIAAVTIKLLQPVVQRWPPARDPHRLALRGVRIDPREPVPKLDADGVEELAAFFGLVAMHRRRLGVALERLDLDTIRLLSMLESDAFDSPTAEDLARLLALFDNPSAHDVVNFALELLPSVLDARSSPTAQVYAVNGYRGLTRSGSIDDLVLTELAYDADVFLQRFVEQELFYHERERTRDREPERHLVLIDATAGMRGLRDTFARGVALAFVQQLVDQRKRVSIAFFDSGLHERLQVKVGSRTVTYMLGFDQGRGRDYSRAFTDILTEVRRMRDETSDDIIVTFITHGRCLVPRQTIMDLALVAKLHGIFVQPGSSDADPDPPDYAHLLSAWQVVSEESLAKGESRLRAARSLLGVSP